MTQLRRSIIAVSAAAAFAGAGLTTATEASATAPPASWDCHKTAVEKPIAKQDNGVYCNHVPVGRSYAVVVSCKIFATGKYSTLVGEFRRSGISVIKRTDCTNQDGYVASYGPRQN